MSSINSSKNDDTYTASAHGRVNLMGEHTDYNGGLVLPMAIPQRTQVELKIRKDTRVSAWSNRIEGLDPIEYELGSELKTGIWVDYFQGVTHILRQEGFSFGGFDVRVYSDVPLGSGLSSSAALQVSLLKAIRSAFQLPFGNVILAKLAQQVENRFVGASVGMMDPMAAALVSSGQTLFIDTRDLSYREISLPIKDLELLVIDSGVSQRNVSNISLGEGGYNQRRAQCEEACRILGIKQLRELSAKDLPRIWPKLPDLLFRRVRHVVTENQRVIDTVEAFTEGDLRRLKAIFAESHCSMRDDFEVSIPEIDTLVDLALQEEGVLGVRLTGGGFGGSVVVLCKVGKSEAIGQRLCREYHKETGRAASVLVSGVLTPSLSSMKTAPLKP